MEKSDQEVAIESYELVYTALLLHEPQTIAQIMNIAVEEALLLDEVDEHHPIEHEGRVPLKVCYIPDSGNEALKDRVIALEPLVELLCDPLDIERNASATRNVNDSDPILFIKRNGNLFKALDQGIAGLGNMESMIPAGRWLARFAPDPLPNLLPL
jgi:hypothetical protein